MARSGDRPQQVKEAEELFTRSTAIYRQINDKGGLAAAYNTVASAFMLVLLMHLGIDCCQEARLMSRKIY